MKPDYLKECLSDITAKIKKSVPIDQFNAEFCVYCINKECARSASSNMLFDRRVNNWESLLFRDVPRAKENDPDYDDIRFRWYKVPEVSTERTATNNVVISAPTTPEVSKPQEVKHVDVKRKKPRPKKAKTNVNEERSEVAEADRQVPGPVLEPKIEENMTESQEQAPKPTQLTSNTAWHQEEYIGPPKNSSKDESEVVVKPGGSFTFG